MGLIGEMPAQLNLADRERDWRKAGRVAELGLSIISEKGSRKMRDPARKQRDPSSDVKATALERKRKSCAPIHIKSAHIIINKRNANTAESNALKVDERLQLARERREAYQKQLVLRERSWLAREERARNFYEKHLEERRRKLEEQRQKEERRRMAVEEKRKQRLKEERERYESVMRRTMEKSQKAKQKLGHCSRRTANSTQSNKHAKRRSLSQWEIELVSRLQTPTISYLARSRSAVFLSRDTASCHSTNSNSNAQKAQVHCGKAVKRPTPNVTIRRTANRELVAKGGFEEKDQKTPSQMIAEINPKQDKHLHENAVVSTSSLQIRSHLRHALPKQDGLPPLLEEEDLEQYELQQAEETTQCLQRGDGQDKQLQLNPAMNLQPCSPTSNRPSQIGDGEQIGSPAWTTNPEDATRLLAEKRKQARLLKEKEEEEHRQKVEMERRNREELTRQRAEERARQDAETFRLKEELRIREEKRLQAEQENARRQMEEENRLHQQREEEARQRAQAEQQRLEREIRFQREEVERQERKKRLEEIMKRTRKTESEDKRPASVKDTLSNENIKPVVRLPGPGKTPKLEMREEEDMLPTVAFKERRSFRPLASLEKMQAHQQTEVI